MKKIKEMLMRFVSMLFNRPYKLVIGLSTLGLAIATYFVFCLCYAIKKETIQCTQVLFMISLVVFFLLLAHVCGNDIIRHRNMKIPFSNMTNEEIKRRKKIRSSLVRFMIPTIFFFVSLFCINVTITLLSNDINIFLLFFQVFIITVQVFTFEGDYSTEYEGKLSCFGELFNNDILATCAYIYASLLVCIASVAIVYGIINIVAKRLLPSIKFFYRATYHTGARRTYVFTALNQKSVALAKNITDDALSGKIEIYGKKKAFVPFFVFCNVDLGK